MVKVNIKKLNEKAVLPTYGSEYAAGADLYACNEEKIVIKPHETVLIKTGIVLEKKNKKKKTAPRRSSTREERAVRRSCASWRSAAPPLLCEAHGLASQPGSAASRVDRI